MESNRFDRLTRSLAASTSRRAGIRALLGIAAVGVFAADTEANRGAGQRHEKLACRNDQSECTANEQCCSGICKPKPGSGTEFRCVGKHKKKDKKKNDNGGGGTPPEPACIEEDEACSQSSQCCFLTLCSKPASSGDGICQGCVINYNYGCTTVNDCCEQVNNPGSVFCENQQCVPE